MKVLTDLPEAIFHPLLNEFLLQDDYQQLLNTSKSYFSLIRRKTIIYFLPNKYSHRYCADEIFRQRLLSIVENSSKQIRLKLEYDDVAKYHSLFVVNPVYINCDIQSYDQPSHPRIPQEVKEVSVDYSFEVIDEVDLSSFQTADTVKLYGCSGITDISPLRECPRLEIDSCINIQDFSSLGKQKHLFIYSNEFLRSVINFRSIQCLIIEDCMNLEDVSPLHGIPDLSLYFCPKIRDISCLGNHKQLCITNCFYELNGYECLKSVPKVSLQCCDISDLTVLSAARYVYLNDCKEVIDVNPLKNVKEVSLSKCGKIRDISVLSGVSQLTLNSLPGLEPNNRLSQSVRISLILTSKSEEFLDYYVCAQSVNAVSDIAVEYTFSILHSLRNLAELTLSYCHLQKGIEIIGCEDIHTVTINHCFLKSIKGLGRNRVVALTLCKGDSIDVSSLVNVPIVSLHHCRKIVNLETLANIPRLKVVNCL